MNKAWEDEIWEAFLKAAVIENSLNEIKDYPSESEINNIVLPEHYDLRIRKIIKRCHIHKNAELSYQYGKRIASIVFIVMGISFSVFLFFNEVRAACQNVIIEIYDRYIRYSYTADLSLENPPVHLGYVPTGYFIAEASDDGINNFIVYQNAYGDSIILESDTQKFTSLIDNEHYSISEVLIHNNEGTFFESEDSRFFNILIWSSENGYFQLRSTLKKRRNDKNCKKFEITCRKTFQIGVNKNVEKKKGALL